MPGALRLIVCKGILGDDTFDNGVPDNRVQAGGKQYDRTRCQSAVYFQIEVEFINKRPVQRRERYIRKFVFDFQKFGKVGQGVPVAFL